MTALRMFNYVFNTRLLECGDCMSNLKSRNEAELEYHFTITECPRLMWNSFRKKPDDSIARLVSKCARRFDSSWSDTR